MDERDRVVRLVRWVSGFLLFPAVTISGAFILTGSAGDHKGHLAILTGFLLAGVFLALAARRIAVKYVDEE